MPTCRSPWCFAIAAMLSAILAGAAVAAPCAKSDDEAVRRFIEAYAGSSANAVDLLESTSLSTYRRRLAQLLDDRYAPASPTWRAKVLGDDWTPARIGAATDAELVSAYLGRAASLRGPVTVSDIRIGPSEERIREMAPLRATYRIESGGAPHDGMAYLKADAVEGCWKVEMPVQAWLQIDKVARALKATRGEGAAMSDAAPRMTLWLLAASPEAVAGAKSMETGWRTIWVDDVPLATEADLTAVSAWWTCAASQDRESAGLELTFNDRVVKAFEALQDRAPKAMLAIIVDGKLVSAPIVRGPLGHRIEICGDDIPLEQAQATAAALRGEKP